MTETEPFITPAQAAFTILAIAYGLVIVVAWAMARSRRANLLPHTAPDDPATTSTHVASSGAAAPLVMMMLESPPCVGHSGVRTHRTVAELDAAMGVGAVAMFDATRPLGMPPLFSAPTSVALYPLHDASWDDEATNPGAHVEALR